MSGAPAAATPAEGGATLQGQLRALSERVLARVRHDADVSSSAELSSDAPSETSRAVGRLQRRALEVLLRFDDDVPVADLDPAERAERNALRLGAAALSMRARGARADADRLESLHDAFVTRRTTVSRAKKSASPATAEIEPLEEHAATLALLLSLANTGGSDAGCGDAGFRSDGPRDESKTVARAARAAAWLRLDAVRLDAAPTFGPGPDAPLRAPLLPFSSGLDATPRLRGLGDDENEGSAGGERLISEARRRGTAPSLNPPAGRAARLEDRSLFGALRRARVPPAFDARDPLAIRVAIGNEPELGDGTSGTGRRAEGDAFAAAKTANVLSSSPRERRATSPAEARRRRDERFVAASGARIRTASRTPEPIREETDVWLAAAAAAAAAVGPERRTSPTTEVFGWDADPLASSDAAGGGSRRAEKGFIDENARRAPRPACDAFLAGGEAAFGDAYGTLIRPAAALFGAARPARTAHNRALTQLA